MYNNPTPVAVALIRVVRHNSEIGLLAGRRTIDPCKGLFGFPGGYIEELETAETAASRELFEETGLSVHSDQFKPVATHITSHNRILIFCLANIVLTPPELSQFTPSSECDELCVVDQYDTLCFPTHTSVLRNRGLWDREDSAGTAALACVDIIRNGMTRDGHNTSHYLQSVKHIEGIKKYFGV